MFDSKYMFRGHIHILLAFFLLSSLKHILCLFFTGIYPTSATEVYTEDFPAKDIDYVTKLCIDWEAAAKLPCDHKTRQVIVRTGL